MGVQITNFLARFKIREFNTSSLEKAQEMQKALSELTLIINKIKLFSNTSSQDELKISSTEEIDSNLLERIKSLAEKFIINSPRDQEAQIFISKLNHKECLKSLINQLIYLNKRLSKKLETIKALSALSRLDEQRDESEKMLFQNIKTLYEFIGTNIINSITSFESTTQENEIARLEKEKQQLQNQLHEAKQYRIINSPIKRELENETQRQKLQLERQRGENQRSIEQLKKENTALQAKNRQLSEEISKTSEISRQLQNQLDEASQSLEENNSIKRELETKIATLNAQLSLAIDPNIHQELQNQLDEVTQSLKENNSIKRELEKAILTLDRQMLKEKEQNTFLQEEKQQLQKQREENQKLLEEFNQENTNLQEENQQLSEEIAEIQERLNQTIAPETYQQLQRKLATTAKQLHEAEQYRAINSPRKRALQEDTQILKLQLQKQREENQKLLEEFNQENTNLQEENQQLSEKITRIKERLAQAIAPETYQQLQNQLQATEQNLEENNSKTSELEDKITTLNAQLSQAITPKSYQKLQDQLHEAEQYRTINSPKIRRLKTKIERLTQENDSLKAKKQQLATTLEILNQSLLSPQKT